MVMESTKVAAAAKAFRQNYSALSTVISHPDVACSLASKLYSKNLVTEDVRNAVQLTPALTPSQQAARLLSDVQSRISPQNLRRFVRVLKKDKALKKVAERLRQSYREILSSSQSQESSDSECEEEDDSSSGAILYKWWYICLIIAVAIAVVAIGVTLLPTTSPVHETQDLHKEDQYPKRDDLITVPDYGYKERLQQLYLREKEDVTDDGWLPVKKVAFVPLAMMNPELEGDTVKDKFQRETTRGSADDILHEKKEVQLHEIFEFEKGSSGARILIEGRPGSGKTTLTKKIARDWANGIILTDCTIFILVPLRQLPNKDEVTLEDLVDSGMVDVDISRTEVEDLVFEIEETKGLGVCFALDGVDEYSAAASETGYIYKLFKGKQLSKSCVIITSHPSATISFRRHASRKWYIEVIGFMSEDVDQYIREYYREQPEKSQQLQKYLDNHLNIKYMCYLPVNLAIIVQLFDDLELGESLPDRETDIYEDFTINSLVRQVQTKDGIKPFSIHTLHEIEKLSREAFPPEKKESFYSICELAFQGYLSGKLVFTERELPSTTFGLLTTDQVFAPNQRGTDKSYSFLHLTFQEFLAAVHLTRLSPEEQMKFTGELLQGHKLPEYQKCQKLEEVLKFYAGLTKLKSQHSMEVFKQNTRHCIGISITFLFESESTEASKWFVNEVLKGRILVGLHNTSIMTGCDMYNFLALVYVLKHSNDAIKELKMNVYISSEVWSEIMEQVGLLTNLKSLRVYSLGLNVDFLAKAPSLEYLSLAGVRIICGQSHFLSFKEMHKPNDEAAVAIGQALAAGSCPNLRVLELHNNHFGDIGITGLATGLRNHLKLEELDLDGNNIGDKGAMALGQALAAGSWPNLRILKLHNNHIGDRGVTALATGLGNHPKLEELDLHSNYFGDKGAVELGKALAAGSWPNLMRLGLHKNHIGDRGITALAKGLRNHSKLEALDICGNKFGDEGFHQLVKVLDGLPQSVVLSFDDTGNKEQYATTQQNMYFV